MRLASRLVALACVGIGLVLLMLDARGGLMNPLRFAYLLTNFGSVMTWGVVFLSLFMVAALALLAVDFLKRKVPSWLEALAVVLSLCVAAYTGVLLGACDPYPLWSNPILPILFVVSALSTGVSAVLLIGAASAPRELSQLGRLADGHIVLPVVESVLVAAMLLLVSRDSVAGWNSVAGLVSGDYAVVFWVCFVVLGLAAPIVIEGCELIAARKASREPRKSDVAGTREPDGRRAATVVACAATLIGGYFLRYLVVVAALPATFVVTML